VALALVAGTACFLAGVINGVRMIVFGLRKGIAITCKVVTLAKDYLAAVVEWCAGQLESIHGFVSRYASRTQELVNTKKIRPIRYLSNILLWLRLGALLVLVPY